jgi:hypothetical protein
LTVRFHFLLFAAALAAAPLRAEMPFLLDQAVGKFAQEVDRWAYTETVVEKDDKGAVVGGAVVRFDPSKPYAEQYTPLAVDGKAPTDRQFKKYRKQGEKRAERHDKAEREGTTSVRKSLGELMDLEHATVAAETPQSVTYEVPLKKEGNNRLPPEKFLVTARVGKEHGTFENIAVKLRSPMRAVLVVKIKSGEGSLEFATVDPKYPPVLQSIRGGGTGSILFVPVGRTFELRREAFQRVKPYAERFGVEVGPLKALDF